MMIGCVIMVSLGGLIDDKAEEEGGEMIEEEDEEERVYSLIFAVVFASLTGLMFSFSSVSFEYAIGVGFPTEQLPFDGTFILCFILFPLFLNELFINDYPFTVKDVMIANVSMFIVSLALLCLAKGIEYGVAGTV